MSTNLIAAAFARQRPCLLVFITAGFPHADSTPAMLRAIADNGADIIELGVPFSDPMADGPAIQRSSEAALANGITLQKTIAEAAAFRAYNHTTPLALMGYTNSFLNHPGGLGGLAQSTKQAGVNGFIVVDLADTDRAAWKKELSPAGISLVSLVAPTTDDERLSHIAAAAEGFVYVISIKGVTGADALDAKAIAGQLQKTKNAAAVPVVAGFGVRTPEQARALAQHADGVVVGSRIVEIAENAADAPAAVGAFVKEMAQALHS